MSERAAFRSALAAFSTQRAPIFRTGPGAEREHSAPAEMPVRDAVLHGLCWQAMALALLGTHVLLVREAGTAFFLVAIVFIVLLYVRLPLAGFALGLNVLLYQNWVLALFSETMELSAFQVLQGTAFVVTAALATIAAVRLIRSGPRGGQALRVAWTVCVVVAVMVAYTVLGAVQSGPTSAIISFRNAASGLLALLVGLDVGRRWGYRTIGTGFLVAAALGVLLSMYEQLDPIAYYEATGASTFLRLKEQVVEADVALRSAADIVLYRTSVFFNITGGDVDALSFRFGGPNMHNVSYAYVLAAIGLVALTLRMYWYVAVVLPLLVLIGVKGALILFLVSVALHVNWVMLGQARLLIVLGLVLFIIYVAFGLTMGVARQDFHVLGFLGGVNGFLSNPVGHGIGVGGNLSTDAATMGTVGLNEDRIRIWQKFQNEGTTDIAVESAVGVLLYQMGMGVVAVFWALIAVLRSARSPRAPSTGPRPTDLLFIALSVVSVNGIFQEEAYYPLAMGLILMFCGIVIANGD
jgi:hypothetical protein